MTASLRYRPPQAWLHWLSAILVFAGIALGLTMVDLPLSPQKLRWYSWHKWLGLTVFLFTLLRVGLRLGFQAPAPIAMPAWQRRAATVTHVLLYLFLLAIPVSGWLYSSASGVSVVYLGLLPLPDLVGPDKALAESLRLVHKTLNYTMFFLLAGHIAGAVKHQLVDRDSLIARMALWSSRKET